MQACPTRALRILKVEDGERKQIIEGEHRGVPSPEYHTNPRVYYKNLFRYTHCFIAGSVAVEPDGVSDCAQGATVTLIKDSEKRQAITDTFGDFKFDALKENSGTYILQIDYTGYTLKVIEVDLKKSFNAGTIVL